MSAKKEYDKEVIMEAAMIVAEADNASIKFVMEKYTPTQLFREVRKLRKAREENMDSIREGWF